MGKNWSGEMGRKSNTKILGLWMNGVYVGRWTVNSSGIHTLTYDRYWLERPEARPISLSLPLQSDSSTYSGTTVENYFENLLPENEAIRNRFAMRYGCKDTKAFSLLSEIGRDCVGSLQILPTDMEPKDIKTISFKALSEEQIEQLLINSSTTYPFQLGSDEDLRISLAGAQEKTALLYHQKNWSIPLGNTPSTHIFKLPIGKVGYIDISTSVENEWLCSQIMRTYGVAVAECRIGRFGNQKTLIVERFDRKISSDGSWIVRVPQEDMCQANGISSNIKYESDGGPGIETIMNTLSYSITPEEDRLFFFKSQILMWLLCCPDGHAKNFSIFLLPHGQFRATPMYDIISAYPLLGGGRNQIHPKKIKMAMAVGGKNHHYHWDKIRKDHWLTTGKLVGISSAKVAKIIDHIIEITPSVLNSVQHILPTDFPSSVADPILDGLAHAVDKLSKV
jgi:serine/threonine-protein kinase HipA